MEAYAAFLAYIKSELRSLASLQLAIDQGMGGPEAREKEEWMAGVIADYCKRQRSSLDQYELFEYVDTIIDDEFDTIIDDGSLEIFARRIIKYRQDQEWIELG